MQAISPLIREIDSASSDEIQLVANRMQKTLIEVLGEEKGTALYSMSWLEDRVRWHLNPKLTTAKIYLYEDANKGVIGHAIARIELAESGEQYGYFSTIYVDPCYRKKGIATSLINKVESWLRDLKMTKVVYNTAHDNQKILRLFQNHKFEITYREKDMVQLTKSL